MEIAGRFTSVFQESRFPRIPLFDKLQVQFLVILAGFIFASTLDLPALESAPIEKPGIKRMQLVTDVSAVTPGEPFTLALVTEPLPGYHTYWQGPGIVGMATTLEWDLPDGFSAGAIAWPAPEKVLMAGITAYGYRSRTYLLTGIRPPATIQGAEVTLRVKCSWMACSKTCNPGHADFSLTLPVNQSGKPIAKDATLTETFEQIRKSVPPAAPASWKITPRSPAADRIELDLTIPGLTAAGSAPSVYFYCHDKQVDSDQAQQVTMIQEGRTVKLRLTLVRPDCAPRSPAAISGVLHCPDGWPGMDAKHVEISAPWPDGTFGRK
jgi:DsbC/DsbD-like thiol-disulfide interchange protein